MKVSVRGTRPHDVSAMISVGGRQSARLWVKRPHNHPVRTNVDRRTCFVVRVGITALSGSGEHVVIPGTVFVGFSLWALALANHRNEAASTHTGGSSITSGFPGMQVKPWPAQHRRSHPI